MECWTDGIFSSVAPRLMFDGVLARTPSMECFIARSIPRSIECSMQVFLILCSLELKPLEYTVQSDR